MTRYTVQLQDLDGAWSDNLYTDDQAQALRFAVGMMETNPRVQDWRVVDEQKAEQEEVEQ